MLEILFSVKKRKKI